MSISTQIYYDYIIPFQKHDRATIQGEAVLAQLAVTIFRRSRGRSPDSVCDIRNSVAADLGGRHYIQGEHRYYLLHTSCNNPTRFRP